MGQCQGSTDEYTCWPCTRRRQEKVFEYQNILGGAEESESYDSRPSSKHSMMWRSGGQEPAIAHKARRNLDELYDQLQQLSQKVKRRRRTQSNLSDTSEEEYPEEARDLVFKTHLMESKPKEYNGGSIVFHSQNIPPLANKKASPNRKESATLINQLNVLQSGCVEQPELHDFKKKSWTVGNAA